MYYEKSIRFKFVIIKIKIIRQIVADIDSLKSDIDKLYDTLRKSEEKIYDNIKSTNKDVNELNISIKLIVEKLSVFIETFKNHDSNEIQKYDDIFEMFKKNQDETKRLEEKISEKYITKNEMKEFEKALLENSKAIKQGFKLFYIGSGVIATIVTVGGFIMWILNLVSQLKSLGVS